MPGAFDYSKWDNINTSSSDDEQDVPSAADSMQALHDYAFSHGMDEELVAETLAQCDGDPRAAVEYLIDFLEMDAVGATTRTPAPPPASVPVSVAQTVSSASRQSTAGSDGKDSGSTTAAVAAMSTWELQEEMAAGLQQIQELQHKRDGNTSALSALAALEAKRAPHQRSDRRANRQWVNMGDLFVKLPQRNLEATLAKDQRTIDEETAALGPLYQQYSSELSRRRALGDTSTKGGAQQ